MYERDHELVTEAWELWKKSLGHTPTAEEVLAEARAIQEQFGDRMWIAHGKHFKMP